MFKHKSILSKRVDKNNHHQIAVLFSAKPHLLGKPSLHLFGKKAFFISNILFKFLEFYFFLFFRS
jgi:hypothetical protein